MGSLNTFRVILVACAAVCAMIAAAMGQWAAASFLAFGVAVHGGMWLWMYRKGLIGPEAPARDALGREIHSS